MGPRTTGAGRFVPPAGDLERLREAAATCEGCPLFQDATRTVFGDGNEDARVVVVGEQPGEEEDRTGEPFSGAAGALLDRGLEQVGIDPGGVWRTYAVKHRKTAGVGPSGRRVRLKPVRAEAAACRPWLMAELNAIGPDLVICLGGTAAHTLLGPEFQVSSHRGALQPLASPELREEVRVLVTARPEAMARLREAERGDAFAQFLVDLRKAGEALRERRVR
jgi:uracil-DNA glycosylase family protein